MALVLSEEHRMLADTAREFLRERAPVAALRALRDRDDPTGFDRDVWKAMAGLGWAGILIDERFGGSGFGFTGLGVVLEESGRTLAASPLVSTALIGASLIARLGTDEQMRRHLPEIAVGRMVTSLALEEGPHHRPGHIECAARLEGGSFVLDGEKTFVLDGHVADVLLVAADGGGGGATVFLVPAGTPGLEVARLRMIDSRNAARIRLRSVRLEANAVLGGPDAIGQAARALEESLDRARIGLAAEMLGGTSEAFERTLAYLKVREQFGVPIGSFQALKHRAAACFCEIELARSAVMAALEAVEGEDEEAVQLLASLAKARLSDTYHLVAGEAVQMHGGIGMTDEEEIGFFLKRARVAEQTFGDGKFHRDRYARLGRF